MVINYITDINYIKVSIKSTGMISYIKFQETLLEMIIYYLRGIVYIINVNYIKVSRKSIGD